MSNQNDQAVANDSDLASLSVLASALSGRDIGVAATTGAMNSWTDGRQIFVDLNSAEKQYLQELCVQCAMLSADSFNPQILKRLLRRPKIANRYLAIEAPRALRLLRDVLPPQMTYLLADNNTLQSSSPQESLTFAEQNHVIPIAPKEFGCINAKALLANEAHAGGAAGNGQHTPHQQHKALTELADEDNQDDEDVDDFASSPVGGGGGLGKLMQKMFQNVRRLSGGGSPGADAITHWTRSGPRAAVRSVSSSTNADTVADAFGKGIGFLYPEWNMHNKRYRTDWCTVQELDPPHDAVASVEWLEGYGLRKPLAQLGMGLDRVHRQRQGDDIDIDAATEAQIDVMTGVVPDDATYIENQRIRRDLSVLILLDISGSVSQNGQNGSSVHQQQRSITAALTTVLYEIGDRVSVYAFHSLGRSAVRMVPIKRFDENLDSRVMNRLHSLKPGAYSRLGAAVRHGTTILSERSGTPRKLLVILSDGLAYDHGYEPAYGAADARQALGEARRDGVGCLCLSVGASTDPAALRRVFGSAAHASVPNASHIGSVIGPLFRTALRAAEVQRRIA